MTMAARQRLLWVTPNLPVRGISAARERWWHLLAHLVARHDITLLALLDAEDAERTADVPPGLARLELVPKPPWRPHDALALLPQTVAGGFSHPGFRTAIAAALARDAFDLVQYEYGEMAHAMPWPSPPAILTVHQLGFAQERARWRAEHGGVRHGAILLHRYLRELAFELRAVTQADHVITMSSEDAARLQAFHPELPVTVSPCGVDVEHFRPGTVRSAEPVDLLFVGHFGHPPNRDAVAFLARHVLPALAPDVRLRIVGHGARQSDLPVSPRIEIVGSVPDVRPHLASARVVVAPVRFGTGMRGKVLEALAMARPLVTTPLGAEGLEAQDGRDLLVAGEPRAFARAIERLLADPVLAERIGNAGRALVVQRFTWEPIAAAHDAIYTHLLGAPRRAVRPTAIAPPLLDALGTRLGYLPGLALGTGLLALRALGWHGRRWLARRPSSASGETARASA